MKNKMGKRELIELTKRYTTVPSGEKNVEYKYFYGISELQYHAKEEFAEYRVKVQYTFFCGEYVLSITKENISDSEDSKHEMIHLGT